MCESMTMAHHHHQRQRGCPPVPRGGARAGTIRQLRGGPLFEIERSKERLHAGSRRRDCHTPACPAAAYRRTTAGLSGYPVAAL